MNARRDPDPGPARGWPVRLERLLPAGAPATIPELVSQLGLWRRTVPAPERAHLMLNMISTVDGRATLGGRSGPISDSADRALFHGLRSAVDAVLVGAGTVRTERYGRIVPDASTRRERRKRGLEEEPIACIVSARLALEPDIPLLAEPAARVVILTPSPSSLPPVGADVEYVRAERDGRLDLPAAMAELRRRFAVQSILCEGGPHLAGALLGAGIADELFLSLSPLLAGGVSSAAQALRILAGDELDPPVALELMGALRGGSQLFLRYGVSARERVSRETMLRSSLAR
jgi:riboflavin biosynthesis pyrimidine reductase